MKGKLPSKRAGKTVAFLSEATERGEHQSQALNEPLCALARLAGRDPALCDRREGQARTE